MHIALELLTEAEIGELAPIMTRAFDDDTRRHTDRDAGGPPGYDDGSFLRKYALDLTSDTYTVRSDTMIIGAAIVFPRGESECFLGNIFIDPAFQDKGVGMEVWRMIQAQYPDVVTWKTETQGFSKRNHHFYVNKCGFHIVRISNPGDPDRESYAMVKSMS